MYDKLSFRCDTPPEYTTTFHFDNHKLGYQSILLSYLQFMWKLFILHIHDPTLFLIIGAGNGYYRFCEHRFAATASISARLSDYKGIRPSLLGIFLQSEREASWDSARNGPIYQTGLSVNESATG